MTVTPRCRRRSDLRISQPTRTSSTGSVARDTRIVSPMPSHSSMPIPDRGFDRAGDEAAGLGDAQMERVVAGRGEAAIGAQRQADIGRLDG